MEPAPRYISTRGQASGVSFQQALLTGLAPDGGLFIPDSIPTLEPSDWKEPDRFSELALRVLSRWLKDEAPREALRMILDDAFSFPAPLVPLNGGGWDGVFVLELFHGPTLSFKDFGARAMARWMAYFLKDRAETLTILVATSGDTGSAVADGFAGQERIQVVLLYPKGQVSEVQERQLIAARPGVQTYAVAGTFDDCQRMVKAAFLDDDLAPLMLSSANSINIGRLLPQMMYYIWAVGQGGFEDVTICVPSGNLGNLTGGVMARLAGLPVRRFLAAHNANDFFPRYLRGETAGFGDSMRTLSNAMDVGAPSNFERLQALLGDETMRRWIQGDSVSDEATVQSMRRVYEATGYLADPHTAVGLEVVRRYRAATGDGAPIIVLATAHPAKFPETIDQALGIKPEPPERLGILWGKKTNVTPLAPHVDALRDCLVSGSAGEHEGFSAQRRTTFEGRSGSTVLKSWR